MGRARVPVTLVHRSRVTRERTGTPGAAPWDPLREAGLDVLRARVTGIAAVGIALVVVSTHAIDNVAFPIRSHHEVGVGAPAVLIAQGVWALFRGRRLTDLEFALIMATWPVMVALSFVRLTAPGSPVAGEWTLLVSAIFVMLFAQRPVYVAAMTLDVLACLVWIVWARLAPTGAAPITITTSSTVMVCVLTAFRAVRDLAVTNFVRLRRAEVTDPLTGLLNRRGLERFGSPLWLLQAQRGLPLAVVVADIDHFKAINDSAGHHEGDRVIRAVCDVLRAGVGPDDVVARIGGEEFALLLAAAPDDARQVSEALRAEVEHSLAPVTISIGVAPVEPDHTADPAARIWEVCVRADGALYAAKRGGRNRVVAEPVAARTPADAVAGQ